MERTERIGIDLDGKNRFQLMKSYFNAKANNNFKIKKTIPVGVFETRHGYHLRIPVSKNTKISRITLRACFGDDSERIAYDEMKLRNGLEDIVDTLFHGKRDRDGKITVEEEINVLAEPFWSKLPCRKRS